MRLLAVVLWLARPARGTYTLAMYREPAEAIAGLPFGSQPVVSILDDSAQLAATFSGYAYAEVYVSPTGTEQVFRNGSSEISQLRASARRCRVVSCRVERAGRGGELG